MWAEWRLLPILFHLIYGSVYARGQTPQISTVQIVRDNNYGGPGVIANC